MQFSPQQLAVFERISNPKGGNLLVISVAGSGKTTVLEGGARRARGSVAICAYNNKIGAEIKGRVADLPNVRAGTFHSFGFGAWRRVAPKVIVEGKKLAKLADLMLIPEEYREFALKLVSLAKQSAFGCVSSQPIESCDWYGLVDHFEVDASLPENCGDDCLRSAVDCAIALLQRSNAICREMIDFDDMIYAPLLFNAKMWQNDWVFVDEAQDTNPARRMLARKMLKAGGRFVAVGDPFQAIYGFTGADNDALDLIARDFNCVRMPLTVTYRCPKAIVAHAQTWVNHIEAHETAPAGDLRSMNAEDFAKLPADQITLGDAVLCRNTAPLIDLAYSLIRRGIGAVVEGRDIGAGILALAFRWKNIRTLGALGTKLDDYQDRETQKWMAKGQELKAGAVADRCDTLRALMAALPADAPLSALREAVTKLFGDTDNGAPLSTVVLSTVHKSKGREWSRVYLLGREALMPSRYARQAWQADQERNLIYVAITRSKGTLVEVELPVKAKR